MPEPYDMLAEAQAEQRPIHGHRTAGSARASIGSAYSCLKTDIDALPPVTPAFGSAAALQPSPMKQSQSLSFGLVTTRRGLEALEADWNRLFDRAGRSIHVFQSFNWCWHWCNHFLPAARNLDAETSLRIITAYRGDTLVLVWPLIRSRKAGLVEVSFLGDPVSQYGDLLIDDIADRDAILDRAWQFLIAEVPADVVNLRRVRADANIAALMARTGALVTDQREAPYLDLASAPDFARYETRYSSKSRRNRRRVMRRFEEREPAAVEVHESGRRARDLAGLAISLKRAWLRDRGLVSRALAKPETRRFFEAVAEASVRPVGAAVLSLVTMGEAAAIEIAFDCKGRRVVHVIVYALKYESAGVGQLLVEQSIRRSFDKGLQCYDLMAPGDAYKLEWADGTVAVADWAAGLSAGGRMYVRAYLGFGRHRLKAAINLARRTLNRFANAKLTTARG